MKHCSKCGAESERSYCNKCNAEYQRERYANNKDVMPKKPSSRIRFKVLGMPKGTHLLNPKREVF